MLHDDMEHEFTTCPECGLPAEVIHRSSLPSTEGPVEHVKVQCVTGHWFFLEARALQLASPVSGRGEKARTARSH